MSGYYYFLLLLGVFATLTSLYTLRLSHDYENKVRDALSRPRTRFSPRTCLIMACKGDEPGLARSIAAMVQQDYDNYYSVIVTDDANDPAHKVAESVIARYPNCRAKLIITEGHPEASGKVAALLTALEKNRDQAEVYAFLDSDALAPPDWLRELVEPLHDQSIGATTGFRWYFPTRNRFWEHVQSAWNASGSSLLFDDKYNFPWGGAMAVRADTLEKIKICEVWTKAVSDDLSLNSALRKCGYKIFFLPQCTVSTFSKITFADFINWATNQTALVRAYNRPLWNYALAAYAFFNITSILGIASMLIDLVSGQNWSIPTFLLLLPTPIGVIRSKARSDLFKRAMPTMKPEFERAPTMDNIASLIVPWVMSYCIAKSARTKEIEWRGRRYRLATS